MVLKVLPYRVELAEAAIVRERLAAPALRHQDKLEATREKKRTNVP